MSYLVCVCVRERVCVSVCTVNLPHWKKVLSLAEIKKKGGGGGGKIGGTQTSNNFYLILIYINIYMKKQ